jgi:hypothetical protein
MKPGTSPRWVSRLVQTVSNAFSWPGSTQKRFMAMNIEYLPDCWFIV